MTASIPASAIVQILPGVVSAGGNPLGLNGVVMDQSTAIPSGSVLQFASAAAVAAYFGSNSTQANLANIYFAGYVGGTQLPSVMYFAPYAAADRAAEILGGSLAGMTLTQLQAINGSLTIVVGGESNTAASINLSSATSFSDAATAITAGFTTPEFAVTYDAQNSRFIVTGSEAGSAETIAYATGTIATSLALTQATAAILSQGVAADIPSGAMNSLVACTQNFATFMTNFEPIKSDKLLFAAWNNQQNNRYAYVVYDSDANTIVANSSTTFAAQCITAGYNGVFAISGDPAVAAAAGTTVAQQAQNIAAFVLGMTASINFNTVNGRITFKFRAQAGMAANVNNQQIAQNLIGNGYNFYGAYATANQAFTFLSPGQVTGQFKWMDSYVNQIWMNNNFQLDLMTLLTSVGSVPYNATGYTQMKTSMAGDIQGALNFGAIRTGVTLSAAEIVAVNTAAGLPIDGVLSTQGFYLQVLDPGAVVRTARGTPVGKFWYTDGGSIQSIVLNSYDVQ